MEKNTVVDWPGHIHIRNTEQVVLACNVSYNGIGLNKFQTVNTQQKDLLE